MPGRGGGEGRPPTPQHLGPRRGARYHALGTLCQARTQMSSGSPNQQLQSRALPPSFRRGEIKAQRRYLLVPGCTVGRSWVEAQTQVCGIPQTMASPRCCTGPAQAYLCIDYDLPRGLRSVLCPEKHTSVVHMQTCTQGLLVASSAVAPTWEQPGRPSTGHG